MTATAAPAVTKAEVPSALAVVRNLADFEGRQMLRHPLLWVGAIASVGLAVFELIEEAPVLNRTSMTLAWTMAPLVVAVALISGWAVLRARARSDAQPPVVAPVAMDQRVAGVAIGLAYPAVATFMIQMGLLGWLMTQDPVTSIVWTELLVGPLYVVLAGTVTAALTRWIPHATTPLMSLLLLGVIQAVVPYHDNWGVEIDAAALSPIYWPQTIIPYEVSFRPAPLHLLYLVGLVLVFAALATMSRRVTPVIVLGVGLSIATGFGLAQLGPIAEPTRQAALEQLVGENADLTCETHDEITYCAMPSYQDWIDDWRQAVAPVVDVAPPPAVSGVEIRQYPIHVIFLLDTETATQTDWWWVETAAIDYQQRDVVAAASVRAEWNTSDLLRRMAAKVMGCPLESCSGESQGLLLTWFVAHDERSRSYILYDAEFSDHVDVSTCMVAEIWGRPGVEDLIRTNWDRLTSPETTYAEAGELLGVAVPEGPLDEFDRIPAGCP